jgi:lipoprotein-anchoring transpeptidase ErfK/SrfK
MSDKSDNSVKLFTYADDVPRNGQGMLIPQKKAPSFTPKNVQPQKSAASTRATKAVRFAGVAMAAIAFAVVAASGYGLVLQAGQVATPIVTIVDPATQTISELKFGAQPALSKQNLFTDTRNAFIDEGLTFIEVDLTKRTLRYFQKGVLVQSAEVFGVGAQGSWWDAPSGLYTIAEKDPRMFTTTGQAYLPFALTFQSNFVIHGWPVYPGGERSGNDFSGGGIKISDADAKALFDEVKEDTPVLVHKSAAKPDTFVYEPQIPDIVTKEYFIADISNGTILAASDLDKEVPIASLTKLMTAVVASEKIKLDGRIWVASPSFVQSMIPRLSNQASVSVYSLMQVLLLESSNEAAEVLAGEVGRAEFITAMNAKAIQLGMLNTTFTDPSGLDDGNISTLSDLYTLTKYIQENKRFIFEITANQIVPSAYIGDEFAGLINFNEIEDMNTFVGGKVGETLAAGKTSISLHRVSFKNQDRVLAVILLGAQDRTQEIEALIQYVNDRFGR